MKKVLFIIFSVAMLLVSATSYAVSVYTIVPLGALPTTVPEGGTVTAYYTVTNNAGEVLPNSVVGSIPQNVTQVTNAGGNTCGATFTLNYLSSCTLQLTISGAVNQSSKPLYVCTDNGGGCTGPSVANQLNVTVTPAPSKTLTSIDVIPTTATIAAPLGGVQLTAMGTYSDGSTADITDSVTWTSSNTSDATVSDKGFVTGLIGGVVTITGALTQKQGTSQVTIGNTYTVTPVVEPQHCITCTGTTSPDHPTQIYVGNTTSFSLSPNTGAYISTVNSTCGGTLNGSTYTTNAVNTDCTVDATFIQEYSQGITRVSGPYGITLGSDGNIWFTELFGNQIGKITPQGVVTQYRITTVKSKPNGIIAGPDGNIWFTEFDADKIGKITPDGSVTEYDVPTANSEPSELAVGTDGNLWFTEQSGDKIGEMSLSGNMIAEYPLTSGSEPEGITSVPDGNLWFTESGTDAIGKITPEGVVTEYSIPTKNSHPTIITVGSDGNLWFTEKSGNNIGKITPEGIITEYPLPVKGVYSYGITAGPDGNVWFTESKSNGIGKITPNGVMTIYPTQAGSNDLFDITLGADGNLWFTEAAGNKIGVL